MGFSKWAKEFRANAEKRLEERTTNESTTFEQGDEPETLNSIIRRWADRAEDKAYADNPAKLAELQARRETRRVSEIKSALGPDLNSMSDDEVELLRLKTEDEIAAMEKSLANYKSFVAESANMTRDEHRNTAKAIGGFFSTISESAIDDAVRTKKLLLHKIRIRQRKPSPPEISAAEKTRRRMFEETKRTQEEITALQVQCEEDVKKSPPEMEESIRRRYRKQIDAILERA